MRSLEFKNNFYLQNIQKHFQLNQIISQSNPLEDKYSHIYNRKVIGEDYLACFNRYNTRGLNPDGKKWIINELKKNTTTEYKIINLGSGSGNACFDIHQISPEIINDSLGLTPFAPEYKLNHSYQKLCLIFKDFFLNSPDCSNLKWVNQLLIFYWWMVKWKANPDIKKFEDFTFNDKLELILEAVKRPWGISFEAAIRLQESGYNIFQKVQKYIHQQYISPIENIEDMIKTKYHFVYDYWGAVHYSLKKARNDKTARKIIQNTINILQPGGILYIGHIRKNKIHFFLDTNLFQIETRNTIDTKSESIVLRKKTGEKGRK